MKCIKVVTAQEMARVEKWAAEQGADLTEFMREAGKKVAAAAKTMLRDQQKVLLLIGKGNKGGDAYVAGIHLLSDGYDVTAVALASECSELNRKFSQEFIQAGGKISQQLEPADLIIDGLLGTGFQGDRVEGDMARAIDWANASKTPILSIDIPSGLDGTSGIAANPAILASVTVTLGLPKAGLFKRSGWNHVGKLQIEDFGLPAEAADEAQAVALVADIKTLTLPPIVRTRHKYERGFAVGLGGSAAMKGAIKLSGSAALHAGAGIVKIFTLDEIGPTADELICQVWNEMAWKEAIAKASSVFIGPGLGRSEAAKNLCKAALHRLELPCVLDADALFFLPETLPARCVLTPHRGEMLHMLGASKMDEDLFLARCQAFTDEKRAILVLKGAPTMVFHPHSLPILIPRGDPGMATAGSGDVLTGIIAALLAQGSSPLDAAILGVTLHALAGEAAALEKTSYSYAASDLIAYLPKAFEFFT